DAEQARLHITRADRHHCRLAGDHALAFDEDSRRRRAEVDADFLAEHVSAPRCLPRASLTQSIADHAGEITHGAGLTRLHALHPRAQAGELGFHVLIAAVE